MSEPRIRAGRFTLALNRTLIMGVVNLTPDSFSRDGRLGRGRFPSAHARFARGLISDGADIIDLGGESTRPGAAAVSVQEELKRVVPALRLLARSCSVPISVDTYKPDVALAALDNGASMINNIMGTKPNRRLLTMVRDYQAAVVLMHMRGTPQTMQSKTRYKNLLKEIRTQLRDCVDFCLEIGIKKDRIIIDPGIGFAKTAQQNLQILNRLNELKTLGLPVLVGTSRKSFIGRTLDAVDPQKRVWGTAATVSAAICRGANIVRVHDVAPIKQVVRMSDAIVYS